MSPWETAQPLELLPRQGLTCLCAHMRPNGCFRPTNCGRGFQSVIVLLLFNKTWNESREGSPFLLFSSQIFCFIVGIACSVLLTFKLKNCILFKTINMAFFE